MRRIMVIGAGGYIGAQLTPKLLASGHQVTCLVRDPARISQRSWFSAVSVVKGDLLVETELESALQGVDDIYYLVHSMGDERGNFEELDRRAAQNLGAAARRTGVQRIIYLGGLGRRDQNQSPHLRSRHEVGDRLRESGVPVVEFRAAVIVGAGSLSFEMIHHLANRLPVMVCPRWVVTKTQPIAVDDVLAYLVAAIDLPPAIGRVIDIGGPDILTYRDMMLRVARILGLRRYLIQLPVLTPRLSSYWVGLVTPVPIRPARALIEGVRHETVCETSDARTLFAINPITFDQAAERALWPVLPGRQRIESQGDVSIISRIEPSHILCDQRKAEVRASAGDLFGVISSIGGENGWYAMNFLWQIRGFIDELIGGVGLRRGRRDPKLLAVGDSLDFWRVEEYEADARLLLRAEMKLPGKAWLEFQSKQLDNDRSLLTQTARFYPRGLPGIIYWYAIYPLHVVVFRRLARAIGKRAELRSAADSVRAKKST